MLNIVFSKWDYDTTGVKIYKLISYKEIKELELFISNNLNSQDFIFTRLETESLLKINNLIKVGFYIADILALYEMEIEENIYLDYSEGFIKIIDSRDKQNSRECLEITKEEFKLGHIYQDPNLGEEFGKKIYKEWCLNNLNGRAKTFVYIVNDKVLGFIQVIDFEKNILQIDLIGVTSSSQSKGVGSKLIDYVKNYALKNKYEKIIVGTQETNYKANKFYYQKGFIKNKSFVSLHFKK